MTRLLASSTAILSTLLISAAPAAADDAQPAAPAPDVAAVDATLSEQIVVTATRSPQPLYRVGSSVTVLTADTIRRAQAVVVSDLIAQTPGVSVSRNGGVGGVTSLRIRGAETDQTVVIVDGVKLNDPSAVGGGYNFGNLLTGDAARIEILRGAQSTLWGSQAIGGVVSVHTGEPAGPLETSLSVEGGTADTGYGRASAGGRTDKVLWRLSGSYYTTDGQSAFAGGTEDDGYRNTGLSGRLRYAATDDVSLDLRAVYSDGRNEFDGFPAPLFAFADTREYATTKEFVGYAGVNFDLFGDRLKNRIAYGYTDTDRDSINPDQAVTTTTFDAAGKNRRWEYQGSVSLAEGWSAVFGAEHEKSSLRTASPSAFDPNPVPVTNNVGLASAYAQVQGEVVAGLTLTGGLRHDDHDAFGGKTLGQAAAAWSFNNGATVLRASFGQGFKAPTLFQLYSNFGNAQLAPEKADSWDAGIAQNVLDDAITLSAIWFYRKTRNQIDFVSCPSANVLCTPGRFGVYDNTASTKAHGLELSATAVIDSLSIQANYTFTNTENTSPGNVNRGKDLARRPKHAGNLWIDYTWPRAVTTGLGVRYVGDAFDNAANSFVLDDYTLVDLRASVPLTETVDLYGRIENLFDEDYQTTRNYGAPGREAVLGVRAKF